MRASRESAKIEAGAVLLPRSASWLHASQREVLQLPESRYADQVDSMRQYLGWSRRRSAVDFPKPFLVGKLETARARWELSGLPFEN